MADEHEDEGPSDPGPPSGSGATGAAGGDRGDAVSAVPEDEHARMRSALDRIETTLDEVAASIARMR